MIEIKYIYFEEVIIVDKNVLNNEIRNENILLIKPKTNSYGIWAFRNINVSRSRNMTLDQYWIDLEKFNNYIDEKNDLRIKIYKVMEMINDKIRWI